MNITRQHADNTWTYDTDRGAWTPSWPVLDAARRPLTHVEPTQMAVLSRKPSWYTTDGAAHTSLVAAFDAEVARGAFEHDRIEARMQWRMNEVERYNTVQQECARLRGNNRALAAELRRMRQACAILVVALFAALVLL